MTVTALLLALLGQCFEAVAARGDQRELRADEERVGAPAARRSAARRGGRPSAVTARSRVAAAAELGQLAADRCGGRPSGPRSPASAPDRRGRRRGRTRSARPTRPASGMWPSSCSTRPPMVSYSPSGRPEAGRLGAPRRCAAAPRPASRRRPRTTSGVASSCSSRTSPTISSIRSSTVTMPAVPPYSSTTSAVCRPLARISVITASPSRVDGHDRDRLHDRRHSRVVDRRSRGTANTCLTCTTPTVSSRSPSITGKREKPGLARRRRSGRRRCRRRRACRSSTAASSVPRRCGRRTAATGPPARR